MAVFTAYGSPSKANWKLSTSVGPYCRPPPAGRLVSVWLVARCRCASRHYWRHFSAGEAGWNGEPLAARFTRPSPDRAVGLRAGHALAARWLCSGVESSRGNWNNLDLKISEPRSLLTSGNSRRGAGFKVEQASSPSRLLTNDKV